MENEQDVQDVQDVQAGQENVSHETWTSRLPEDIRSLPSISKFKDETELAKSYVNLEKLVSRDKIPMPKDENDQAGWETVFSRLGRPESSDKYDLKIKLNEGLSIQDQHLNGLKAQAHKLGLSSRQLQGMIDYWTELENGAYSQRQNEYKESEAKAETTLRRSLGANFESARKNVEAFVKSTFPKEAQGRVLERVKRDPEEFEAFFNASKYLSEDVLKVGKPMGMSPAEAELEYKRILSDVKGAFYDPMHPEHELTKKKMMDLLVMMGADK